MRGAFLFWVGFERRYPLKPENSVVSGYAKFAGTDQMAKNAGLVGKFITSKGLKTDQNRKNSSLVGEIYPLNEEKPAFGGLSSGKHTDQKAKNAGLVGN